MTEQVAPLVPFDMYRTHAVHIGTNQKSADMNRFLDTDRQDGTGLHLIDIEKTDERIRVVASFLNRYDPSRVLVVSARQYGQRPARKFAQAIGAKRIVGRFIPGTLTNPRLSSYIEPEVLMVTDPSADLAHGYEGTELLVKGDKRIQGFIQSEGDPLVIRVFGGEDLVIAKSDIKSRKKMHSSLMAPANRLGLNAQQLRDVVEYLKLN